MKRNLRNSFLTFFLVSLVNFSFAQDNQKSETEPTSAEEIGQALNKKQNLEKESLIKNVPFINAGPTIMSGRVVDIDVNPSKSTEFYVGYATGGVWHTENNGITFTSVFDTAPTQNVGDIAIDWKTGTIWVGTGETISSRSSYAGVGILKSTDGGKTWEDKGLVDTHHISDIIINPKDPNTVWVAALGHLYSSNAERGVFKTTDGGNSWKKTLFVSDDTGVISMVAAPQNPDVIYAAAWDRDRKAWDFRGSGKDSGIYKSTDAGETWSLITTGNGFPQGEGVGRIGLAVYDENTVYAVHDNQFKRPKTKKEEEKALHPEDFQKMTSAQFLKLDNEELTDYLKSNRFPREYDAAKAKEKVEVKEFEPIDFYRYVTDENSVTEDSEVIGAEIYLTEDGGKTWHITHEGFIDDFFYSYGYVFAEITVNPKDKNQLYLVGVPLIKSKDGGKTFTYINEPNLHVDHHVVWVDPDLPGHLINGNDGGLNISFDDGKSWMKNNSMPLGQFYNIDVDYQEPYNIYGGLQDNGTWMGPHNYTYSKDYEAEGEYPFKELSGGDGMQVEIDRRNPNIVYAGSQFGFYNRINLATKERKFIKPSHSLGESPYRFNWQTPILLSPHNQDILYMGANKLMRSMNQGDDWTAISPD
ncbi:MAG: glycosyl hydrolase, partial [Leeuwenhoekiella sp.]